MIQQSYTYEILFRGSPDGTVAGAHKVVMERFLDDDGTLLLERPGEAQPLSLEDAQTLVAGLT